MPKSEKPKGKRPNLFFLTGENDFELMRFLKQWEKSALAKYGEFNVSRFNYAEKKDVGEIIAEINAPPFFGDGKRVFFIENFPPPTSRAESSTKRKEAAVALANALLTVPEECVVVLASPNPDKRTTVYKTLIPAFTEVKEFPGWQRDSRSGKISSEGIAEAVGWVMREGKAKGIELDRQLASFIVEFCGTEPWKLHNELEKLLAYKNAVARELTKVDIEELCQPSEEMGNFAFSNAVQSGNIAKVLAVFDQLMASGEAPQAIFARDVIPTIRQLLLVRSALDANQGASSTPLHPFVFEKLKSTVRNFSLPNLLNAHNEVTRLDLEMKTGKLPVTPERTDLFRLAVERLFISLFANQSK